MTLGLPVSTLFAFLLVLARVAGFVTFLPVPGFRGTPDSTRVVLAGAISLALFPVWPALPDAVPSMGQLLVWVFAEAGFGLAAGLAVAFLTEGFQLAAQVLGLQAGYGYASTIDPASEADSSVLQVVASLSTALLFFALGLDHQLIRLLAASFERFPAGSWIPVTASTAGLIKLGSGLFSTGLRMAFPVVALLILIDFALALIGRVQQQLQLLSLAFPVKMAAALALLAALSPVLAKIFGTSAQTMMSILWRSLGA